MVGHKYGFGLPLFLGLLDGRNATTDLFGGLLRAVEMDWIFSRSVSSFAGPVLFWFRCAPYVWKRFVPHVIDMVRLFCEEVSACVVGSILVVQAAVMAFAFEIGYC